MTTSSSVMFNSHEASDDISNSRCYYLHKQQLLGIYDTSSYTDKKDGCFDTYSSSDY